MKVSQMFPKKYVTGFEMEGRECTVTIASITKEKMRVNSQSPEMEKFVLYAREGRKGIVLSAVLARQIQQILGSEETNDWIGRKVTLFTEKVRVAGVDRVVIRAKLPDANGVERG